MSGSRKPAACRLGLHIRVPEEAVSAKMAPVNHDRRAALARAALSGYAHGPQASLIAREQGLNRLDESRVVVLVEGVSDQMALDTLATRRGRDLAAERVTVVPVGGAHGFGKAILDVRHLLDREVRLAGLCDASEDHVVRHGLSAAGVGSPGTRGEMEALDFYVCVEDLEDELIRALGAERAIAVLDSQGDRGSFEKLRLQPAWRNRPVDQQLRRFIGSGARRKLRYARLLAGSVDMANIPRPIVRLFTVL